MNTEANTNTTNAENAAVVRDIVAEAKQQPEDIVKQNIMRELPCKLDDVALLKVARDKAGAEAELEETESDFADAKDEWGGRIKAIEKRIAEMGAELRTGEQKRVIKCYERFVAGTIEVVRSDTKEVVERRAANLSEAQRSLSDTKPDGGGKAAADAAKTQRDNGVEENDDGDVVAPSGDGKRKRKNK